jgi:hypothetical protein
LKIHTIERPNHEKLSSLDSIGSRVHFSTNWVLFNWKRNNLIMKTATPKKLTKVQELERTISILESALYQAYQDQDEVFGLLYLIINEAESPEPNKYQLRKSLQGLRTLLIANQCSMMDCAGLEY